MNNWQNEKLAELHRLDLINERKQIRLESLAMQSHVYRPSLFTRTMHSLAGWMILKGKELHARYELPIEHSHHSPSGSFAH